MYPLKALIHQMSGLLGHFDITFSSPPNDYQKNLPSSMEGLSSNNNENCKNPVHFFIAPF